MSWELCGDNGDNGEPKGGEFGPGMFLLASLFCYIYRMHVAYHNFPKKVLIINLCGPGAQNILLINTFVFKVFLMSCQPGVSI